MEIFLSKSDIHDLEKLGWEWEHFGPSGGRHWVMKCKHCGNTAFREGGERWTADVEKVRAQREELSNGP